MKSTFAIGLCTGMLLTASGCAHNYDVADNTTSSGVFYDTDAIFGHNNTRTVEPYSRLDKISIIGDGNTYVIEDGVMLTKVEIFGKNNTVSTPDGLVIQWTAIGEGNKRIERTADFAREASANKEASDARDLEKTAEAMPVSDEPSSP